MTVSYQIIRLLTHIKDECGVQRENMSVAVYNWMVEGVAEQSERTVHHVYEGYKKTSTNDRERKRRRE